MAARSQNGWSANDRSAIASYALPGGRIALRKGAPSVVLLWCANRWHETVEELRWPGNWGYAERPIRGSTTTLSNHASGTSLDLNAPLHPLGTDPQKNFTPAQLRAVRAIVQYCEGVVRWGGDYTGRPDGMHLELNAGAAAVERIAEKIRDREPAPVVAPPKPPALPSLREDGPMIVKSQPDKSKPDIVAAVLTGFNFVGLGRTEVPSDEQARAAGLSVLWVEYGTWLEFDRRSHVMLGTSPSASRSTENTPASSPNPR